MDNLLDVELLLVEDNEIDVMAFERGIRRQHPGAVIVTARDGREALEILRGTHASKSIGPDYLIFLDLNMPIMNGREFLQALRSDDQLCHSIVFVLTTSDHDEDLLESYRESVAGYILKKDVGESYCNLNELIQAYVKLVVLP
ncbi:MAG: response regulator [Planctomycetota bacterium]